MDVRTRLRLRALAEGWTPTTSDQVPDMGNLLPGKDTEALNAALLSVRGVSRFGVERGSLRVDALPGAVDLIVRAVAPLGWKLQNRIEQDAGWTELVFAP